MNETNELYLKYARVIEMCRGTALEETPWLGVKHSLHSVSNFTDQFSGHPTFLSLSGMHTFLVAILEDEPVFPNDVVYDKVSGKKFVVDRFNEDDEIKNGCSEEFMLIDGSKRLYSIYYDINKCFSWQPPAPKQQSITLVSTGETRRPREGEYAYSNGVLQHVHTPKLWKYECEIWKLI